MTSLQHRLMLLLSKGQQSSNKLYELEYSQSHIRRTLIKLKKVRWIKAGLPLKVDSGQGRPLNTYRITKTGSRKLKDYEQALEKLR